MDRLISTRNAGWLQGHTPAGAVLLLVLAAAQSYGQSAEVTLRVDFSNTHTRQMFSAQPPSVAWLMPLGGNAAVAPPLQTHNYQMVQKDKMFDPHLLVVPVGSVVVFPNRDPFFHNVFSIFNGKRFDLGLYEAGSEHRVRFDREGVSYIFCNIHPEMSAVVITIATPFYAISNAEGQLNLAGVPYGRYLLHIWSESMGPENTQPLTREITIAENASSLGVIKVPAITSQRMAHKNKYGRDYEEPTPNNSVYNQQR